MAQELQVIDKEVTANQVKTALEDIKEAYRDVQTAYYKFCKVIQNYQRQAIWSEIRPQLIEQEILGEETIRKLESIAQHPHLMNTKNWSIKFPKKILLVDADPKIALRNISADLVLQTSDISSVITALKSLPARSSWADVTEISFQARKRIAASDKGKAGMTLVSAIEKSWPSENYIVCDMAISGYWTGVYLQAKRARQISYPVGWGTLGFGLPASLGPSAAGFATLVVCGDGGIAFGLGELATVAQEQLPLTILLHDDGGYGMLRFDQQVMKHPERGVNLFNPDWQVLAQSFGIEFMQTNLAQLSEVLAKRSVSSTPGIVLIQDPIYPPKSTSPRWSEK